MVEVFKTDVPNAEAAALLISQMHPIFPGCRINFDLSDCDRVLRIECATGSINARAVVELLKDFGFRAEVLPDEVTIKGNP